MRPSEFLALATAILCFACRQPPSVAPSPMQLLFEHVLTFRDTSLLERAVADSLIFHARGQSATVSRPQLWQMSQPILTAFPDARFRVEDQVISGDKVAARISLAGTHRGAWSGIQPTNRRIQVSEMFICRVKRQRLTECWQEWDELGLRRQLEAP